MRMLTIALSSKFRCNDCEHVNLAAETIGEERGVGVTSRRNREGAEVINADGPFRQGHRDDDSADRQS